jgi:hypothetical protein
MGEKIIVLVSDRDDNKHGEISVLDDPHKAERLVETLLEAGFEEDRIRVFSGTASEFEISHRPVVSLVSEGGEDGEGERGFAVERDTRETKGEDRGAHAEAAARETEDHGGKVEAAARETEDRGGKVEVAARETEDRGGKAEAAARETEDRGGRVEVAARETEKPPSETEAPGGERQEEAAGDASEEEQVPVGTEAEAPVRFSSLFRSS